MTGFVAIAVIRSNASLQHQVQHIQRGTAPSEAPDKNNQPHIVLFHLLCAHYIFNLQYHFKQVEMPSAFKGLNKSITKLPSCEINLFPVLMLIAFHSISPILG